MTPSKDFMYDTGTDLTGREFQTTQIMVKNPCSLNPLRFAVECSNDRVFQHSNASHNPTASFKTNLSHRIFHPKGLKTKKFSCMNHLSHSQKSQLWGFRVNPHETDPSVDQAQDQTVQALKRIENRNGHRQP